MTETAQFLLAYDQQLRGDPETRGALAVDHLGPLTLASYPGGRGFVTYPPMDGLAAHDVRALVGEVVARYRADPWCAEVEWKTRGHDRVAGLTEALLDHGFHPEPTESIMIGRARLLDVAVPLPPGVTLRRLSGEPDVRAMAEMQDAVFGTSHAPESVAELMRRLGQGDPLELWVAEAAGGIVAAGRLEGVEGSDFAGIWGGAVLPAWRGRGIYRALTAARARGALGIGKTLINSDSTEYSRPILERSGLLRVSTTTPYRWHR